MEKSYKMQQIQSSGTDFIYNKAKLFKEATFFIIMFTSSKWQWSTQQASSMSEMHKLAC
jgi:hypothetical protein